MEGCIKITQFANFSANWSYLEKQFNDPEEKVIRDWFMELDNSFRDKLQPEWIKGLHKFRSNIPILDWFQAYCLMNNVEDVYS